MEAETYRVDHQTGEVYRYNETEKAYLFIGSLNGRTETQFISDIEERESLEGGEE